MFRSAHSIRRTPSPASARSLTSCLRVAAITLLWVESSCGEQPLVLALLPVERVDAAPVQPRRDGGSQVGLAPQACCERDVVDADREALPELPQGAELVQLPQPVGAIARAGPVRDDEAGVLEVAEHPRRPARVSCRGAYTHRHNLTIVVSGFGATVTILEADDVLEMRCRDLEDRRVLQSLDPVDRARLDPERRARADHLRVRRLVARRAHLDLRAARLHEPRLVLLAVELEAQRLAGLHEEQLAAVVVGERPDQFVAPGLLDLRRLDCELLQPTEIGRGQVLAHAFAAAAWSQPGLARTCSSATRRSLGVFTVSQTPSCR